MRSVGYAEVVEGPHGQPKTDIDTPGNSGNRGETRGESVELAGVIVDIHMWFILPDALSSVVSSLVVTVTVCRSASADAKPLEV
jgi:hypothetical protein